MLLGKGGMSGRRGFRRHEYLDAASLSFSPLFLFLQKKDFPNSISNSRLTDMAATEIFIPSDAIKNDAS